MEAKLIKTADGLYHIKFDTDKDMMSCALVLLSLKKCQAIERGYDLDELVKGFIERTGYNDFDSYSYKLGFQKALELMGDKKFSEEDVISMIEKSRETGLTAQFLILTKQQTEWDVEVEMVDATVVHPGGDNEIISQPKLDVDGCLILKLKS